MAKKFDWKITAMKVVISVGMVICAGIISLWQNDPKYMFLIPMVEGILNYLKHK